HGAGSPSASPPPCRWPGSTRSWPARRPSTTSAPCPPPAATICRWRPVSLCAAAGERALQGGPLEEHDGLRVVDPAGADHPQGLAEGQFDDLDVLALLVEAPTLVGAGRGSVGGGVEADAFGDRAGAHVDVEDMLDGADGVT